MYTFKEITNDHGYEKQAFAADNNATYILTSSFARDKYELYIEKYDREPSSRWFNRNFRFERIKKY